MKHLTGIISIVFLSLTIYSQHYQADTIRLYYLGGQSNMDGCGYVAELPDSLNITFDNVWIFHGNPVGDNKLNGGLGKWSKLKPGHGAYFSFSDEDNILSDRFGVELSFASRLHHFYPNEKIAIIKYSQGATSLDSLASEAGCWDPDYQGTTGINQYDNFLTTIRNAQMIRDIDGDGRDDILIPQGIIWMQGESDAREDKEIAGRYYYHLKRLMDLIRAALLVDDLPVVIGKISDSGEAEDGKVWDYLEVVQEAQEKFAREDRNATIVRSTKDYNYSDPWHYDSEGFIDLGIEFAKTIQAFEVAPK